MAKTPPISSYKSGSEAQPRHLVALSDKEVFLLRSLMMTLVANDLKGRKSITYTFQKDTGRLAKLLSQKMKDLVDDILKLKPDDTRRYIEKGYEMIAEGNENAQQDERSNDV